jgi:8-oxo-dGTP pyrophosphatase MutT (NUDIX family)
MRWQVHGERSVYGSDWMSLRLVDIEIPDGPRFEHHVVRFPRAASGTVVFDPARGVLLLWRHRFATDSWGWEVPAGGIDDGETPEHAAERETLEETGWKPGLLTHLVSFHPINGSTDQVFHAFLADGATHVGEPTDVSESERVEWVPVDRLRDEIRTGHVVDGLSLTALLYAFTFGVLPA